MPIPYARAGVENGQATATCPECNEVFTAKTSKQAVHLYGVHYDEQHDTEGRLALFSGDWLLVDEDDPEKGYRLAYEGRVFHDGYWSGGVQWFATLAVAERLVAEQKALAGQEPASDIGRMTIVKDGEVPVALVTYEPADGEFYTESFTPEGLVQVPSWTWFEVRDDDDTIKEIVR